MQKSLNSSQNQKTTNQKTWIESYDFKMNDGVHMSRFFLNDELQVIIMFFPSLQCQLHASFARSM